MTDIETILAKDPDDMTPEETNVFQIYMIGILTDRVTNQSETIKLHEECILQLQSEVKMIRHCAEELQGAVLEMRDQLEVIKSSGQHQQRSSGGIILQ